MPLGGEQQVGGRRGELSDLLFRVHVGDGARARLDLGVFEGDLPQSIRSDLDGFGAQQGIKIVDVAELARLRYPVPLLLEPPLGIELQRFLRRIEKIAIQ